MPNSEPSIRKYLRTLLEVDGYQVETLPSGKEALQRVGEGERPDFIILDVLMPEMDGLETLRQLMQQPLTFLIERLCLCDLAAQITQVSQPVSCIQRKLRVDLFAQSLS